MLINSPTVLSAYSVGTGCYLWSVVSVVLVVTSVKPMNVKQSIVMKLESAYLKCLKMFFNFHKFASVTGMLLELRLPSFCTL